METTKKTKHNENKLSHRERKGRCQKEGGGEVEKVKATEWHKPPII